MEKERVILRSYSKVWKIERYLYNLGEINLPNPIALNTLIYWMGFSILMVILSKIPLIGMISPMYKFLVIPGALAWFFNNKLLDGKNPLAFIRSILVHYYIIFFKGHIISRFRYIKNTKKAIYKSKISYRILKKKAFD